MDLALRGVERRRLEGPLTARAYADSVDLGLLEALTPAVDRVEGRLAVNVQVEGTWKQPRLAGTVAVSNGTMNIPGLGVHFGSVDGSALLQGDSVVLKDVRITSGGGALAVRGGMQLEDFSRPILALDARADQFRAIDVRNFLTLVATGDIQLRGPVSRGDPDRQPDGQQRRALLRRPGQQAGDRPGGSDLRRPARHHAHPAREPGQQVPEPVPGLAPGGGPAGRHRERRLAPERRGQHPARRLGAADQVRAGVPADRDAQRAAGQLHAQDRAGHPRLHRQQGTGAVHRDPERQPRHPGAAHGARRPGRGDPHHRQHRGDAVRAQGDAGEHPPAADLGDRPGLLPRHRLPGQRRQPAGPVQRGADRAGLLLQRALQRAGARADPGLRRAHRPDRDPAGGERRAAKATCRPSSRPAGRSDARRS